MIPSSTSKWASRVASLSQVEQYFCFFILGLATKGSTAIRDFFTRLRPHKSQSLPHKESRQKTFSRLSTIQEAVRLIRTYVINDSMLRESRGSCRSALPETAFGHERACWHLPNPSQVHLNPRERAGTKQSFLGCS